MNRYNKTHNRFSSISEDYNKYRPQIPDDIFEFVSKLIEKKPHLVIDLGSGTGESSLPWKTRANKVIGIEPTYDMYAYSLRFTDGNLSFENRYAHDTGLPDDCADIITCASSLHWLEPKELAVELRRILKSGGVFCSYSYYYPFFNQSLELTHLFEDWRERNNRGKSDSTGPKIFNIQETIKFLEQTGIFRYVRKTFLSTKLDWRIEDFKGFVSLYKDHEESSTLELLNEAERIFQDKSLNVYFTYTVYVCMKK